MSFRTEMGLYYSYYKTIVRAPTFIDGLQAITRDNVTEYPNIINTLKRFNVYPEVVLGAMYRVFDAATTAMKVHTKDCWSVNRGEDIAPVMSCEGIGDPMYFYVHCVILLNSIMLGIVFLFGTFLSDSILGGIVSVASFFFNHGECTRVMWTTSLRESHAYPFFVLQMLAMTYVLRQHVVNRKHLLLLMITTTCFILPWQFAQFTLMTQILSAFGCYVMHYVDGSKLSCILRGHLLALCASFLLLFGNEMLLTSWYFAALVAVQVSVWLATLQEKLGHRILVMVSQGFVLIIVMVSLKSLLSWLLGVADDAHISDILRSKFGNFNNFHTMLYTCAKEFDFMELETPKKLTYTLLLPTVVCVCAGFVIKLAWRDLANWRQSTTIGWRYGDEDKKFLGKDHAEVVFNLLQLVFFSVMAIIIMRLKVFWTPHLCIVASLIASRDLFGSYKFFTNSKVHGCLVAVLVAVMAVAGSSNIDHQWSIKGEFSNYPLEELIDWVNGNTHSNAVFAGPMPTMANLKLSTGRAVVNHPHYEDANLRERTMKVYSMYSRKPIVEVRDIMKDLKADYIVLEKSWCSRRSRPGCSMPEIWDVEDPTHAGNTPACDIVMKKPAPYFRVAFRNSVYTVLVVA